MCMVMFQVWVITQLLLSVVLHSLSDVYGYVSGLGYNTVTVVSGPALTQ